MIIEAAHYSETRTALEADPIILEIAFEILLADTKNGGDVDPSKRMPLKGHNFMMGALKEYNRRDGKIGTHIGGPSEALRALVTRGWAAFDEAVS